MNDKLYNLLNDPNVEMFLTPTPQLQQMIENNHPLLENLRAEAKAALLEGKVLPLDKNDVYKFVMGQLEPHASFLLSTGDIRVRGTPSLNLSEKDKGST